MHVHMSVLNVGAPRTGVTGSDSESPDVSLETKFKSYSSISRALSC